MSKKYDLPQTNDYISVEENQRLIQDDFIYGSNNEDYYELNSLDERSYMGYYHTGYNRILGLTGIKEYIVEDEFYCYWCSPDHPFAIYCCSLQMTLFEQPPLKCPKEGLPRGQSGLRDLFVFEMEEIKEGENTNGGSSKVICISDPSAYISYRNRDIFLGFQIRLLDVLKETLKKKPTLTESEYTKVVDGLLFTNEMKKMQLHESILSMTFEAMNELELIFGGVEKEKEEEKDSPEQKSKILSLIENYKKLSKELNELD